MSLIVNNRAFKESIPQGIELRPSDFRARITDIPVDLLLEVIARTFGCGITYCNSHSNISEIKFFLLGEAHGDELNLKVHTTLMRLLIKDGDCIGHEGWSEYGSNMHKDKDATDMVDGEALQRDVNYWSWELEGLEKHFEFSGRMMRLTCVHLEKMEEALKHRIAFPRAEKNYRSALRNIHTAMAKSGRFQITAPLLKLYQQSQTARNPLARALLGMSYVGLVAMSTYAQTIEQTFEPRQECLAKDIEDMTSRPVNTFFLAGYAHVLEKNGEVERNIYPALDASGVGYLATRIDEFSEDSEEAENPHEATMHKGHLLDLEDEDDSDFASYETFDQIDKQCQQLISVAAQYDPEISNEFLASYQSISEILWEWT